jgi:hypothetical protein
MSPKRVDIQAALRDPAQRKRLLAALFRSVKAIGRDGTHPLPPERHVMSAEQFKSLAQAFLDAVANIEGSCDEHDSCELLTSIGLTRCPAGQCRPNSGVGYRDTLQFYLLQWQRGQMIRSGT